MKISANFSNFKEKIINREIKKYEGVQTKIAQPVRHDTFERQQKVEVIKTPTIQDINGNRINAEIRRITKGNYKKYNLYVNEKSLGYAITTGSDYEKGLYLSDLYSAPHNERKYKSIGTELLKCVVEESIDRGFDGKIYLEACNMPPPYIFYYKNNFTVSCYSNSMYNAIIDYAARNNIKAENTLVRWGAIEMRLDEKGAEALLKNKREYETRRVETLGTKDTLDAMLIQSKNKDENYLLIVDKKAKEKQAKFTACLNKEDNKIRVSDIFNWITNKEDETFMENMLKEAAKSLGAENYYIEEN